MPLKSGGTRRQVRRAAKAAYPNYHIRTRIPKTPKQRERIGIRVGEHPRKKIVADVLHRHKSGEAVIKPAGKTYPGGRTENIMVIAKRKKKIKPEKYRNVRYL